MAKKVKRKKSDRRGSDGKLKVSRGLRSGKQKSFWAIVFVMFAFFGFADSLYLTYAHYNPDALGWCDISPELSCDIVNRSEFSTVDGVINYLFGTYYDFPVSNALLGSFVFLFLFICALHFYYKSKGLFIKKEHVHFGITLSLKRMLQLCRLLLVFSVGYGLFLIYIQKYVLMTWCILCIVLDIIIFLSLLCVWRLKL
jgi:uncharacterized membrane protein